MSIVNGCVAGIDVHKKMLAVVVRREQDAQVQYEKRKFGTTRLEIEHLAAWLQQQHVSEVVMESTAQYWRPVWYGLEAHFRLHLTHPLKTKAPRGRKRDYRDGQRLADLDGVHGAILAASVVWAGGAFPAAFDPPIEDQSAARSQTGLPGRPATGGS